MNGWTSRISDADALRFAAIPSHALLEEAAACRDGGHGSTVTYSKKVFIPLTQLCRDVCHYCTFAQPPKPGARTFLTAEEVLDIARRGAQAGCKEALFTLGDKPELRWRQARSELEAMGFESTLAYLAHVARIVLRETGLLPHLNPGVMTADEMAFLRPVSVSMGIMLETASQRLSQRGGVHFGSPDKDPAVRLACIEEAGRQAIPFTTGILIGIGETRRERIESLLALRELHERYGHLQEIIIQNFLPKPRTKMAEAAPADKDEHLWTVAVARLIFGPAMNIQAPPNLSPHALTGLIDAGINDWGGISPVTIDHVNPEAPWPEIRMLAAKMSDLGKTLVERLAIYPSWALDAGRWTDAGLRPLLLRKHDADGLAREDAWTAGAGQAIPAVPAVHRTSHLEKSISSLVERAKTGSAPSDAEVAALFGSRGDDFVAVTRAADRLRQEISGNTVHYVVNRNINYTNVCVYSCSFCAFSKGRTHEHLRGTPYDLDMDEFSRRVSEAWERGATEVCLQGGIHPDYTGDTYLTILRTARAAAPDIHIHAFSPLEVWQGATTLGLPLQDYLLRLKDEGLASLPGTAAEILDDEVRSVLCPDKLSTAQWFEVMEAAHSVGLRSTATIMFGHVDRRIHWARHLIRIRALQERTNGFTEFVPLPFVAQEAPIFLKNGARQGPTFREAVLMHAVARLVLHPAIQNIQTSWVKMGPDGAAACLRAGANDLGGTLMNESITRAAGAIHGQEFAPARMQALIESIGRAPVQRTTSYGPVQAERIEAAFAAPALLPVVNTPLPRRADRRGRTSAIVST